MSDWHWEVHPDDLLEGLPAEAREQVQQLARELVVRDSMVYLDGKHYEGLGPGLEWTRLPGCLPMGVTLGNRHRIGLIDWSRPIGPNWTSRPRPDIRPLSKQGASAVVKIWTNRANKNDLEW